MESEMVINIRGNMCVFILTFLLLFPIVLSIEK